MKGQELVQSAICLIGAGIFGFSAIILPGMLGAEVLVHAPLFPRIQTALATLHPLSIPLLFLSGLVPGWVCRKSPIAIGLAAVAIFPVLAVIEKCHDITSHPHFPVEFAYYMLLGAVAAAGAHAARVIRRRYVRV